MNKRNKIIVSIVGITIVLLALLGITYAYYLTRIEGNTNTNSISITTANLKLKYEDGNGLLTATNITPGKQVEFKTTGNQTTTEKTFTVTNNGNSVVEGYAVSLDYAYIADVMPSIFERPEDFQITLTCSTNKTGDSCNGFKGNFNNESIMLTSNDIDEGETHTYSLSIYYNEPGVDQSNDMGKNLNLKVQIYSISETTDIEGTITGVDSTHSVRIESEPKMSTIVNGKYNFKGVEIGTHTITILDKDGNEIDKEYIVVKSGTEAGITATKATIDGAEVDAIGITVTENERVVKLSTKVESSILSFDTNESSTGVFNPYSNNTNSLAYQIINNATKATTSENNSGYAMYREIPQTKIAEEISSVTSYSGEQESTYEESMEISTTYQNKTWYFYDGVAAGERYEFFGINSCTYSSCYKQLENKVIFSDNVADNTDASQHPEIDGEQHLIGYTGYKVIETTPTTLKYVKIYRNPYKAERSLSLTKDDYGNSYYYRGAVENNYVNFAGMCWRIVRIKGNGDIKLILDDAYANCNDNETTTSSEKYTGNWNIGSGIYGHDSNKLANYLGYSGGMSDMFKNYQLTLAKKMNQSLTDTATQEQIVNVLDVKLAAGDWCNTDKIRYGDSKGTKILTDSEVNSIVSNQQNLYYDSYKRLKGTDKTPSLKCNGNIMTNFSSNPMSMYIGTLTVDEILFAGGVEERENYYFYLMNNYTRHPNANANLITMSPSEYSGSETFIYAMPLPGYITGNYPISSGGTMRPAINLKNNIKVANGIGTQTNPYVIQ